MPKFTHDCSRCEFIGTLADRQDLYVCDGPAGISLILRYGDKGWEYASYNMSKCEFTDTLEAKMGAYREQDKRRARIHAIAKIIIEVGSTAISNDIEFAT